jgi:hypothetical protein
MRAAVLFAVLAPFAALAKEDAMIGLYGNTLIVYDPGTFERHTWFSKDGTAVHIDGSWMPEGLIALRVKEDRWRLFDGFVPRIIDIDSKTPDSPARNALGMMLHNHYPGTHWHELIPSGPNQDLREQYTIVPGRQ